MLHFKRAFKWLIAMICLAIATSSIGGSSIYMNSNNTSLIITMLIITGIITFLNNIFGIFACYEGMKGGSKAFLMGLIFVSFLLILNIVDFSLQMNNYASYKPHIALLILEIICSLGGTLFVIFGIIQVAPSLKILGLSTVITYFIGNLLIYILPYINKNSFSYDSNTKLISALAITLSIVGSILYLILVYKAQKRVNNAKNITNI